MNEPLSPHLQIYRWQITSVLSALHRLSGIAISILIKLIPLYLVILGFYPDLYTKLSMPCCALKFVGTLFLWAFFYHMINGIRHLIWDLGIGFSIKQVELGGWFVVITSFALTALWWLL